MKKGFRTTRKKLHSKKLHKMGRTTDDGFESDESEFDRQEETKWLYQLGKGLVPAELYDWDDPYDFDDDWEERMAPRQLERYRIKDHFKWRVIPNLIRIARTRFPTTAPTFAELSLLQRLGFGIPLRGF
jgi:hypothetical protein